MEILQRQHWIGASCVAQSVKHLPAMQEAWVQFLGQEDPLEKEMATHSSTLAWRIPWREEPGRLQSMGLQRVRHNWATSLHFTSRHFTSHASKVMLKILQARLQQYVNRELADVQAGFRKGRGTRDQTANSHWIIKKAREFQKNIYFCFIDYAKAFDCVDHNKLKNSERDGNTRPPDLPLEKSVCRSGSNSWNWT